MCEMGGALLAQSAADQRDQQIVDQEDHGQNREVDTTHRR